MKKSALVLALAAALSAAVVMPVTAQQPGKEGSAATQVAPNPQVFDKQAEEARALFQRMQEQMNRINQTQDPQERQRLMQEHWTTMQSAMGSMHGMWGPGMMGCCGGAPGMMMHGPGMRGWGGMQQHYRRLTPEQLQQRQYMMDQYLGMQQMMMDHMLQQQRWMQAPQGASPR